MKKILLTLLGGLSAIGVNAQTLQTVTDNGKVSARDDANIIFQKATTGAGRLYLQFNNSDGSRRGWLGYGATGVNNFYINNDDNTPIFLQNRTLINGPISDDGQNGLQVKSGLALYGSVNNNGNHIRFKRADGSEMAYMGWLDESQLNSNFMIKSSNGNDIIFNINDSTLMRLKLAGGYVGIGASTPLAKLDVRGNLLLDAAPNPIIYTGSAITEQNKYLLLISSPTVTSASGLKAGGVLISDSYLYANPGKNDLVVKGNVAIGTASAGTYKLAVEGTIGARKIKVTQENPWADFVFENDYQLPTLQETDNFIKANKHLPNIPTAAEVKKNGVDLGEMNTKLLQKVEELTLHLIEQNKRVAALEKEVKVLKKK
jgi:hypothetical protein